MFADPISPKRDSNAYSIEFSMGSELSESYFWLCTLCRTLYAFCRLKVEDAALMA